MYSNYLEFFFMKDVYLTACLRPSSFLLSFPLSSFLNYLWQSEQMDIHTLGDNTVLLFFLLFLVIGQVVLACTIGSFSVQVISSFVSFPPMYDAPISPYIFLALVLSPLFLQRSPIQFVCIHQKSRSEFYIQPTNFILANICVLYIYIYINGKHSSHNTLCLLLT